MACRWFQYLDPSNRLRRTIRKDKLFFILVDMLRGADIVKINLKFWSLFELLIGSLRLDQVLCSDLLFLYRAINPPSLDEWVAIK